MQSSEEAAAAAAGSRTSSERVQTLAQSVNRFKGWASASLLWWELKWNLLCHVHKHQVKLDRVTEPGFASRLVSTKFHVAVQKPGVIGRALYIFMILCDCSWNTRIMRLLWAADVKADALSGWQGTCPDLVKYKFVTFFWLLYNQNLKIYFFPNQPPDKNKSF